MIGAGLPRITCVTVTTGRLGLLKKSLRCYAQQTYPNRDMVVLSQGTAEANDAIEEHLRTLGRSDIAFYRAAPRLSLGGMRNTAVEIATGDLICQWDDDDLYHPDRLVTQYNSLRTDDRRVAALYCDFLKYFKTSHELYWCDWSGEPLASHKYLCGTILFYKELFHAFTTFYPESGPQCHVEEDLNVLEKAMRRGEIGGVLAGHQYVYVYHGGNTYDIDHHYLGIDTSWGKKLLDVDRLNELRPLLEDAFAKVGMDSGVAVRSHSRVAFTYESD